jgi:hypothetical protein
MGFRGYENNSCPGDVHTGRTQVRLEIKIYWGFKGVPLIEESQRPPGVASRIWPDLDGRRWPRSPGPDNL